MLGASLLFALMGVGVKLASAQYNAGEIVMYRASIGLVLMAVVMRSRGIPRATSVAAMHFWRCVASARTPRAVWPCFWALACRPLPRSG